MMIFLVLAHPQRTKLTLQNQSQKAYQPLHRVRNDKDSLTCNVHEPSGDNEPFQRLERRHLLNPNEQRDMYLPNDKILSRSVGTRYYSFGVASNHQWLVLGRKKENYCN